MDTTTIIDGSRPSTTTRRAPAHWATFVVIGAVGGVLSGLFAIGGAILMVPLLVWRARMDQRQAAATSLVAIIPTAIASSTTYLLHGYVDVVAAALISVGAMAGAVIGTRVLRRLSVAWLRWAFIGFIVLVAAHMMVGSSDPVRALPLSAFSALGYVGVGLLTGVASGMFGIGGAIISVPLLGSVFGFVDVMAKGTALLVSIPTSLVGTAGNRRGHNPVDVRAGVILGVAAAVTSVPAVYLAVALPPAVSSASFGALLLAIAAQMTVTALRSTSTRHPRHDTLVTTPPSRKADHPWSIPRTTPQSSSSTPRTTSSAHRGGTGTP